MNRRKLGGTLMAESLEGTSGKAGVGVLSRLMAGDEVCYFKPWYEMRHPDEVQNLSKELAQWKMNHTELVGRTIDKISGGDIFREEYLTLDDPPIAGKVDILHVLPGGVHVYEIKSGRKAHSHYVQLLLYLFLANRDPRFKSVPITGHLVYESEQIDVKPIEVPGDVEERIRRHASPLLSDKAPRKIRSGVCRYCWADCEFSVPRYGGGT